MTIARLAGNMPYLATLPSCVLYLRPFGTASGGTVFKDWSPLHNNPVTNNNCINSTSQIRYTPASMYFPGAAGDNLVLPMNSNYALGTRWIGHAWVYNPTGTSQTPAILTWGSGNLFIGGVSTGYFYMYGGTGSALNAYSSAANQGGAVGWHHWVFGQTAAGFNPFVYRDGASVTMANNSSGTGGFGSSSINLTIGISPYETYYPQQFLDEVALWSTNAGSVIPTAAQLNALTYRRFIV